MLHLAAPKKYSQLDPGIVFEELARERGLGTHTLVSRSREQAKLLELLVADHASLVSLLRIRKTHLAVVENSANGRQLISGHFDEVQAGLPGLFPRLTGRHKSQ